MIWGVFPLFLETPTWIVMDSEYPKRSFEMVWVCLSVELRWLFYSLKLIVRPQNMVVGTLLFFLGWPIFSSYVSFLGCINIDLPPFKTKKQPSDSSISSNSSLQIMLKARGRGLQQGLHRYTPSIIRATSLTSRFQQRAGDSTSNSSTYIFLLSGVQYILLVDSKHRACLSKWSCCSNSPRFNLATGFWHCQATHLPTHRHLGLLKACWRHEYFSGPNWAIEAARGFSDVGHDAPFIGAKCCSKET